MSYVMPALLEAYAKEPREKTYRLRKTATGRAAVFALRGLAS